MEFNESTLKSSVDVSKLVDKMYSYFKGGGEHKKSSLKTKYFNNENKTVKKDIPSKYNNQNPVCLQSSQPSAKAAIKNRPLNRQSYPLETKRTAADKQFELVAPRKKRTLHHIKLDNKLQQTRKLHSSLSEPVLNGKSFDENYEMYYNSNLPELLYKKMALKRKLLNNNKNVYFNFPPKFDTRKEIGHYDTNITKNEMALLTYNPCEGLQTIDDDNISESCSTFYASSIDNDFDIAKFPNIRKYLKNNNNDKYNCGIYPYEHFEDPYYTLSLYLKEGEKLAPQKTRQKHKTQECKQKPTNGILVKSKPRQMVPKVKAKQFQEYKNTLVHPLTFAENDVKSKKKTVISTQVSQLKALKSARNPIPQNTCEVPKEKVSQEKLWKRFEKIFKSYASTKTHSAVVISYRLSTAWMKDAGVIYKYMNEYEANESFKKVAGLKLTMNIHEYKEFLINLTMKKKLQLYEIYRKMCGF